MTELVLRKIGKHFGVEPWLESKNDYLVLNDAGRAEAGRQLFLCNLFYSHYSVFAFGGK